MAIKAGDVRAATVGELLKKNLIIPKYQRPYSWKPETALQLLEDIIEARADTSRGDSPYVLGTVIIHRDEEDEQFSVVDGQQRLLTLKLIIAILDNNDPFKQDGETRRSGESEKPEIISARNGLNARLGTFPETQKPELKKFIEIQCHLVQVVTDSLEEAFRIFDSQNYRGKRLAPHDLLKAHHLREMQEAPDVVKIAAVEKWECHGDADLSELFSVYLYRINKWSRGESAAADFSDRDIGLFKGISTGKHLPPSARYHLSAQASFDRIIRIIRSTHSDSLVDVDDRMLNRSRFQLDAPIIAGRHFFEMITFMLEELAKLKDEAYQLTKLEDTSKDALRNPRTRITGYRHVETLYLAAILYFTNKFGDDGLSEAKASLLIWAYSLITSSKSLGFPTINKVGRGDEGKSAFILLRNAMTGSAVHQLFVSLDARKGNKDNELLSILKTIQGQA